MPFWRYAGSKARKKVPRGRRIRPATLRCASVFVVFWPKIDQKWPPAGPGCVLQRGLGLVFLLFVACLMPRPTDGAPGVGLCLPGVFSVFLCVFGVLFGPLRVLRVARGCCSLCGVRGAASV